MAQRIFYGSLAILALCAVVMFDERIAVYASHHLDTTALGALLQHGSLIPIAVLLMMLLSAVEFRRLASAAGARPFSIVVFAWIALLVLSPWLSAAGWLGGGINQREGLLWPLLILAGFVPCVGVAAIARGRPTGIVRDGGVTLLAVVYLGLSSSFAVQLRCEIDTPAQGAGMRLLVTVLVIKASDIGAFFVGSMAGRHKLVPTISPSKSWEGALAGMLASAAASCGLNGLIPYPAIGPGAAPFGTMTAVQSAVLGVLLSIAGQLGDLLESCFKRDADIKDSGAVIPQFGGILDLVDSPIMAMPIAWFLLTYVWGGA